MCTGRLNPFIHQTENLILESHCRWVAALTGFFALNLSVCVNMKESVNASQCLHQCSPHQTQGQMCDFLLFCHVTLKRRNKWGICYYGP